MCQIPYPYYPCLYPIYSLSEKNAQHDDPTTSHLTALDLDLESSRLEARGRFVVVIEVESV
jgi:hypothetical protein